MSNNIALDEIWDNYLSAINGIKMAEISFRKTRTNQQYQNLYKGKGIKLLEKPEQIIKGQFKRVSERLEEYYIFALWVCFERIIMKYFQKKITLKCVGVGSRAIKTINTKMEYWPVDEILDLLKDTVDGKLVGDAKNIKNYRDWVAHKNTKKTSVSPEHTYNILSQIVKELLVDEMRNTNGNALDS